jgi:flagellar protein FlaG
MSAETITTAIFLITAVVATAVLVNAIYPVIYSTAGTFQSSTNDADTRLRTDFKIVANFANTSECGGPCGGYDVYMKNIGSKRISLDEIKNADVFCGSTAGKRLSYNGVWTGSGWTPYILSTDKSYWNTGETLAVYANGCNRVEGEGNTIYFQFILTNGIWRSTEFTTS